MNGPMNGPIDQTTRGAFETNSVEFLKAVELLRERGVNGQMFLRRGCQSVSRARVHGFRFRGDWLRHSVASAREPQAPRVSTPRTRQGGGRRERGVGGSRDANVFQPPASSFFAPLFLSPRRVCESSFLHPRLSFSFKVSSSSADDVLKIFATLEVNTVTTLYHQDL